MRDDGEKSRRYGTYGAVLASFDVYQQSATKDDVSNFWILDLSLSPLFDHRACRSEPDSSYGKRLQLRKVTWRGDLSFVDRLRTTLRGQDKTALATVGYVIHCLLVDLLRTVLQGKSTAYSFAGKISSVKTRQIEIYPHLQRKNTTNRNLSASVPGRSKCTIKQRTRNPTSSRKKISTGDGNLRTTRFVLSQLI